MGDDSDPNDDDEVKQKSLSNAICARPLKRVTEGIF